MEIIELPKDRPFSIGGNSKNDFVINDCQVKLQTVLIIPKNEDYFHVLDNEKSQKKKVQQLQHKSRFTVAEYSFTFLKTLYSCRLMIEKLEPSEVKGGGLKKKALSKSVKQKTGNGLKKKKNQKIHKALIRAQAKQESTKTTRSRKARFTSLVGSAVFNLSLVVALCLFVRSEVRESDAVTIMLRSKIQEEIQQSLAPAPPPSVLPPTSMLINTRLPNLSQLKLPDLMDFESPELADTQTEAPMLKDYSGMGLNSKFKGGQGSEFRKRVASNNGRYDEVGMRVTLLWDDVDDLDLHVITPDESEINFINRSYNRGVLDVDKNAKDPVRNPVENIFWETVPQGTYDVYVVLFSNKSKKAVIDFKLELNIHGKNYIYKSSIRATKTKERVSIVNFEYLGAKYHKILWRLPENYRSSKGHDEEVDIFEDARE